MAEVTIRDPFGKAIYHTLIKYRLRSVLEIGAFNGDGSTQVIAQALTQKVGANLTSLEYDLDRYKELVDNTKKYPFIKTINQSSIGSVSFTAWNFDSDIWNTPYNGLKDKYPIDQVSKWHQTDIDLLKKIPLGFLDGSTDSWDAVLIDGGEFCGYDEFRLVKERTQCIMLDDAYRAFKTFKARIELSADPEWRMEWNDPNVRNGAAIFVRRTLLKEPLLYRLKYWLGWV